MKHCKLFLTYLFLTTLSVGNVWGDSYTITFSNSVKSSTSLTASTKASTVIAEDSRTYVATSPFTINSGNCWYGDDQQSIRIGSSGASSSLSIALSESAQVNATGITINCMNLGGKKNSSAQIGVYTQDKKETSSTEQTDVEFELDGSKISSITLTGDAAIKIYSITVTYSSGSTKTTL